MARNPGHRASEVRPQDRWEMWADREEKLETIGEIEPHEPVRLTHSAHTLRMAFGAQSTADVIVCWKTCPTQWYGQ